MGTITKIKPWAQNGNKTKPADVKIETGWIGGEQPPHEYENERMNTRDTKLNEVIDQTNRGSAGADKLFNNLAAGAIKDIAFPFSNGNVTDLGNGFERDACLYDHNGIKLVLTMHQPNPSANWHFYGINIDTGAIDVDLDLGADMGLSGHRIWAMACDGGWIYLLGEESSLSVHRYQVYARDITGTPKPGFGYNQLGQEYDHLRDNRPILKVLESGDIFAGGKWMALGPGVEPKCHIIDATTGTITRSGDVDLATDQFPSGDCVECGGHIYFSVRTVGAGNNALAMVDEGDLTAPATGTPGIQDIGSFASGWYLSLATMGDYIGIAGRLTASDYPQINLYKGGDFSGFGSLVWSVTGSRNGPMFFDGHNLWVLIYSADTTPEMLMVKVRPQWLTYNLGSNVDLKNMVGINDVILFHDTAIDTTLGQQRPPIVFDGASIWVSSHGLNGGGVWQRVVDAFTR